jgi:predicted thioesterase
MPEIGMTFTSSVIVSLADCAVKMGSGDLEVLATPAMIALMENAAMNAVAPALQDGVTTVGAEMNTTHIKPSTIGAKVRAVATLTAVEGRKLTFDVEACDEVGAIGKGTHVRFVVDKERFMAKLR